MLLLGVGVGDVGVAVVDNVPCCLFFVFCFCFYFVFSPFFGAWQGKLTSMHFYAWKKGLKTGMYYLRTKPRAHAIQFTVDQEVSPTISIGPLGGRSA